MRKKIRFSSEEKLQLILTILKNPKKMDWYLGQVGIQRSTYYKWRSRFFEGGKESLKDFNTGPKPGKKPTPKEKDLSSKLKIAEKRINTLATEVEVLKKNEI